MHLTGAFVSIFLGVYFTLGREMNYPLIPTDNLYKFIALSGLAITLLSLTYPVSKLLELELAAVETKSQQKKLAIEDAEIKREIEILEKEKNPSSQTIIALRERMVQQRIKAVEFSKIIAITEIQLKWVQRYINASIAGLIIGPWIAFFGFKRWYINVQRPLDEQIKRGRNA